ncbi:MAG: tetratricopeptide repeat protein [Acidobacteria bacterium]|nr:tetratricopeptide repeat protein [Acidobacteriota bacterium]
MPGFSSGIVPLSGRGLSPGADIGPVVLHRLTNIEGNTVSATSLAAPKEAQKALDKGREAVNRRKWDDAAKQFEKATVIYPRYATAWYELGRVRQRQDNVQAARTAYLQAIQADPGYVQPYVPLAHLCLAAQEWQEAVKMADEAIRLDPAGSSRRGRSARSH